MQNLIHINPNSIIVEPDRQRKEIKNLEELAASMRAFGLISPVVIASQENPVLIAGERRTRAAISLGWGTIPAIELASLDPLERRIIELEENVQREDLDWRDKCLAYAEITDTLREVDPKKYPSNEEVAKYLGVSGTTLGRYLMVARELGKPESNLLSNSTSVNQAANIIKRQMDRAVDTELSKLFDTPPALKPTKPEPTPDEVIYASGDIPLQSVVKIEPSPPPAVIDPVPAINASFLEWAPSYSGPKFNVMHCDFPYGINHGKSAQGGAKNRDAYDDSPDVYWDLVDCFIENQEKFLLSSSHMIFWFSMNYYEETRRKFTNAGWFVNPNPLIWHKSDNKGIVSDPERRPRHTYETAFFCTLGDRKIIRPFGDSYAAPTAKNRSLHISEKPEPVLRKFFTLCVDNLAEVLDPTCGAGSALRAADSLGANRIVGLDINPEYVDTANAEFKSARNLRNLTGAKTNE